MATSIAQLLMDGCLALDLDPGEVCYPSWAPKDAPAAYTCLIQGEGMPHRYLPVRRPSIEFMFVDEAPGPALARADDWWEVLQEKSDWTIPGLLIDNIQMLGEPALIDYEDGIATVTFNAVVSCRRLAVNLPPPD